LLEPYQTSDPIKSNTLEDLIDQLDIDDKKQALKTVLEYNSCACDVEDGFDPTKKDGLSSKGLALEKTNWALRLDKPPYYAYSATGGITFTFGGLKVNENALVIGTDWRPIKGLYCCGEMVGGLFYDNYPAGTGLVSGATFGRIAGRNAATRTHEQVVDTSYATRPLQPNPLHQPQTRRSCLPLAGSTNPRRRAGCLSARGPARRFPLRGVLEAARAVVTCGFR
jgi:hypothetical protein